jgi:hypothetical protein
MGVIIELKRRGTIPHQAGLVVLLRYIAGWWRIADGSREP